MNFTIWFHIINLGWLVVHIRGYEHMEHPKHTLKLIKENNHIFIKKKFALLVLKILEISYKLGPMIHT